MICLLYTSTTAILSFRSVWNAFLWPMLVINDYAKLTLTVGLKYLKEWEDVYKRQAFISRRVSAPRAWACTS